MRSSKKVKRIIIVIIGIVLIIFTSLYVLGLVLIKTRTTNKLTSNARYRKIITTYDESNSHIYGSAPCDQTIDFESFYGVKLQTNNDTVSFSLYANIPNVEIEHVRLESINEKWTRSRIRDLDCATFDEECSISTKDMADGIYTVTCDFDDRMYDGYFDIVTGYFCIKNKIPQACRVIDMGSEELSQINDAWADFTSKINPADYLDNSEISYPTVAFDYNNVSEFEKLSDDIVEGHSWDDATKVFAFAKYISENYAYDSYREDELNHKTRAEVASTFFHYEYENPQYYMYTNKVGICYDFVNVMAIMCRHHGIPCTDLSSEEANHTISIVCLNDEWIAIDLTGLVEYKCATEDTNKDNWIAHDYCPWYRCYGFQATQDFNEIEGNIDHRIELK